MGFTKEVMLFLSTTTVLSFFMITLGATFVYKVGDDAGWKMGSANLDYHTWAAKKFFHVGDILVFQYDRAQDNVLRVNLPNYHKCNTANPITTYSSGNDSITIKGPGHYYYISGFPGHCQTGQKIDVRVLKVSPPADLPSPSASPSPAPAAASSSSTTSAHLIAPSPVSKSSAALFTNNGLSLGLCLTLFMFVVSADYLL